MDLSIILAQFWGSLFIILGLLSLKAKFLGKTIKRTDKTFFTVSTGYITMLLGLGTVILHNLWVLDWRILVTLLGWITLLKGITKMSFPEHVHKKAQMFKNNQSLEGIFMLILGLILLSLTFT